MSMDGTSIRAAHRSTWRPDPRTRQYYECWGSRAMYADGWKAVTNHVNQLTAAERDAIVGSATSRRPMAAVRHDRPTSAETRDLAADRPEKLAELMAMWHEEADRNQVLPIDDSRDNRIAQMHLPWLHWQATYHLRPGDKLHESHAPMFLGGFRMVGGFSGGCGAMRWGACRDGGPRGRLGVVPRAVDVDFVLAWNGRNTGSRRGCRQGRPR